MSLRSKSFMNNYWIKAVFLVAFVGVSGLLPAQPLRYLPRQPLVYHQVCIDNRSPGLNRRELWHLGRQQRIINQQRHWALRDGRLNGREIARLHALKQHQRRDWYRFRHNRFQR